LYSFGQLGVHLFLKPFRRISKRGFFNSDAAPNFTGGGKKKKGEKKKGRAAWPGALTLCLHFCGAVVRATQGKNIVLIGHLDGMIFFFLFFFIF